MTTNPLDEIAARADAATLGPWEVDRGIGKDAVTAPYQTNMVRPVCEVRSPAMNSEFIAHAREDVPRLLNALRAVEAVHKPEEYARSQTGLVCTHCIDAIAYDFWPLEYPCPTIKAIREALG